MSAQTALRESIGRHHLAEMITERETLGRELQRILDYLKSEASGPLAPEGLVVVSGPGTTDCRDAVRLAVYLESCVEIAAGVRVSDVFRSKAPVRGAKRRYLFVWPVSDFPG